MPEPAGTRTPAPHTDIASRGWITRLPPRARPYAVLARLDRPIGVWVLLLPGWWAIAMAAGGAPSVTLLVLFAIGAVVMRAAGCVMNDIADRKFDPKVARTANRPIASGAVTPRQALVFLGALLVVGLAVLLSFNRTAWFVGAASLPFVLIYPYTKRVTDWPQAFLGLTMNWGALLGWAAAADGLALPAFLLYAAGFFWTLGYDTIYAHQDKEDDLIIGVRSSALRLGANTRPFLFAVYAAAIALLALAGLNTGLGRIFLAGLGLAAAHLAWQAATVKIDDPADCLAKFKSNIWFGLIVFAAVLADKLYV